MKSEKEIHRRVTQFFSSPQIKKDLLQLLAQPYLHFSKRTSKKDLAKKLADYLVYGFKENDDRQASTKQPPEVDAYQLGYGRGASGFDMQCGKYSNDPNLYGYCSSGYTAGYNNWKEDHQN